jgi:hypothetical protein
VEDFDANSAQEVKATVRSRYLTFLMYVAGGLAGLFFVFVAVWVVFGDIQLTFASVLIDAAIILLGYLCAS